MKKVILIGAGQTGRGYLARLLSLSGQPFVFLDKNEALIEALRSAGSYKISFGDSEREPLELKVSEACVMGSAEAAEVLADADFIFTSIAEQNLPQLIPALQQAVRERTKPEPLKLITCENGVSPKKKLEGVIPEDRLVLSEAVIFCTTLKAEKGLDILSEDLDWLPYDVKALGETLSWHGMEAEEHFPELLERKIYTYNCLSACVTYPGAALGYENYAEAANDPAIEEIMKKAVASLSKALAARYGITEQKQHEFAMRAVQKFQNRSIRDTIERNARDVQRKLGPKERMIAPLLIMKQYGADTSALEEVIAAALLYGRKTGMIQLKGEPVVDPMERLPELCPDLTPETVKAIRTYYRKYENR